MTFAVQSRSFPGTRVRGLEQGQGRGSLRKPCCESSVTWVHLFQRISSQATATAVSAALITGCACDRT